MAAKINLLKSGKSVNTKTVILIKANELINEVGISDFRVDTLATSLGLSPGNITYHFHRKDDIAFALWNLAIDSVKKTYMHYVSSILDITQLAACLMTLLSDNKHYISIIAYKLGDVANIGAINHDKIGSCDFLYNEYVMIIKHLVSNGCLNEEVMNKYMYITFNVQLTLLCWWVNSEYNKYKNEDMGVLSSRFAIAVINPLVPFMTEEGLRQFERLYVNS